jgi:hypothetical protein
MLFLRPADHIRFCVYQKEVIILDLKNDRYIFLQGTDSDIFLYLFECSLMKEGTSYRSINKDVRFNEEKINTAIKDLREAGILSDEDFPKKYTETIYHAEEGMANIDWNLTSDLSSKVKFKYVFQSYLLLVTIFFIFKMKGFYYLVNKIRNSAQDVAFTEKADINDLVVALNKACSFFPVRVKCLEWSATLYFLAKKYNIKCEFLIGVQNYPFKAHAWIEHNNRILADSNELGKSLAIILREPV